MSEIMTHYPAGADVPDWLIAVEPGEPGAVFESLKFVGPAVVVDLPDRYLVFSPDLQQPPPGMCITGGANRVYAAAKPVHLVQGMASFWTLDVDAWTPVSRMAQQGPAPGAYPAAPPIPQRLLQQAPPGLLARLWAAFKGY